ncbi:uncharacterized protein LOC124111182 [Haliotis rufescens]|uniref:uncharacterized protein LOC124111182 n=1 Tax=Haliotis rufescens TaxID=6454 RepID=UPI00201F408A|nr:uncharacterized protein LOC124111182 [Haliotis rufescens]
MRSMLFFCMAVACFGALDARARTVRRDLTLEADEEEFINEFDSFLDDSEGVASQNYWPNDAKPLEEFGLMQKSFISDMVLQTCIVSGVFLRKGETTPPTDTKRERLVTRLLELLRSKRSPNNPSGSMDWENDPFVLLEDAEAQYRNLCISLFELRRLNRKLAGEAIKTTTPVA